MQTADRVKGTDRDRAQGNPAVMRQTRRGHSGTHPFPKESRVFITRLIPGRQRWNQRKNTSRKFH